MGWREEVTAVLKKALAKATSPKEIREIASALERTQPWEDSPGMPAQPMPVRIVKSKAAKKPAAKGWRKKVK